MRAELSIDDIAASLAANRIAGTATEIPLPGLASEQAAYELQDAATDAYDADLIGYALAGANPACRSILGLDTPILAPVADRDFFRGDSVLRLPQGVIGAQCELVFVIGRSYPDKGEIVDRQSVAETIVACRPAIGIVGRRIANGAHDQRSAIADFGLHVATICGPAMRVDWTRLGEAMMTARIDGKRVMTGRGDAIYGDPLEAVAWLARKLAQQDRQISAGEFVATGSCAPILQVLPGQDLNVGFDAIGEVSCSFE